MYAAEPKAMGMNQRMLDANMRLNVRLMETTASGSAALTVYATVTEAAKVVRKTLAAMSSDRRSMVTSGRTRRMPDAARRAVMVGNEGRTNRCR
jgi:hypothetical protein